jgi:hypothetical protein
MEEQETTTTRGATPAPEEWCFEKRTVESFIDHLMALVYEMGVDGVIEQAEPTRWRIGQYLADSDPLFCRTGFIYMLDAMVRTPDIHLYFFNRLREALIMIGQGTGLEEVAPPLDAEYAHFVHNMPEPIPDDDRPTTHLDAQPLEERTAAA